MVEKYVWSKIVISTCKCKRPDFDVLHLLLTSPAVNQLAGPISDNVVNRPFIFFKLKIKKTYNTSLPV